MLNRNLALLVTLALASTSYAQFPVIVLEDGDQVAGVGAVVEISACDVNDHGRWTAVVRTDQPNPNADFALLRNGAVMAVEGAPVSSPAGASATHFGVPRINNANQVCSIWSLQGTGSVTDDKGVYCNGELLIQKGDVSTAPGFTPGTHYVDLHAARISDVGTILLVATVDDPAMSGPHKTALMVVEHDGAGNVLSESIHVRTGDIAGGTSETILELATEEAGLSFAHNGRIACRARLSGPTNADSCVLLDGAVAAREGSAVGDSITTAAWKDLAASVIDVNRYGQLAIYGLVALSGGSFDRLRLYLDDRFVMGVGNQHLTHGLFEFFQNLGSGHSVCTDGGEVIFYGESIGDLGGTHSGLFTRYQDLLVSGLMGPATSAIGGFRASDTGRFMIFIGAQAGSDRLYRWDRAIDEVDFCIGYEAGGWDAGSPVGCPCLNNGNFSNREGCRNSQGHGAVLDVTGSREVALGDTVFHLSQARPNQPAMLLEGRTFAPQLFRDGAYCLGNPTTRVTTFFTDGAGLGQTAVDVAARTGARPGDWPYYQIWYRDPAISTCGTGSNFTQGVRVLWK